MDYNSTCDVENFILKLGFAGEEETPEFYKRYGYKTFSLGNYKMTIFRRSREEDSVYGVSFEYADKDFFRYLLATSTVVTMFYIDTVKELLEIVSRMNIEKCCNYSMEQMVMLIRNIMNDMALDMLEG